jgi:hypothetical protein
MAVSKSPCSMCCCKVTNRGTKAPTSLGLNVHLRPLYVIMDCHKLLEYHDTTMLQLLLGPLGGGGGGSGGKGHDSPNDTSAVGLSLSPLPSPLNLASVSSPGPLSPSRSAPLHSRTEVDQRTQSRRKISNPPKVVRSHFHDYWNCVFLVSLLD